MTDMALHMQNKKTIIVSHVVVKGYIKHANGRKTMFEYNKQDFEPKVFEAIFTELGRKYE
jgi:hypothetical protein